MQIVSKPVLLVVVGGLLLGTGAYVYLDPTLRSELKNQTRELVPSSSTTLYKWQDASGRWHVEDSPPPAGVAFEVLDYRHDANVMPAVPAAD